ncbi:GNAT family N-acetyltransferase [Paenibacillus tengchongensis]|uniref:GNAT family N-acetyltransferase n=1 Tax=Paenibacillus tengchongensis TaxID=2608684 RepID=UPI00124F278A|nr:GNAT family N-acetyltransferase [Paenibacillus tengchongensis]
MERFIIRNPVEEDFEQIGDFNFVYKLHCLYHGDYDAENMFVAMNETGGLSGIAQLAYHGSFHADGHDTDPDFIRYLNFELDVAPGGMKESIRNALTEALLKRAAELKALHPAKRIAMTQFMDADHVNELGYYLGRGFTVHNSIAVFQFDLSQEIPAYPPPAHVTVTPYTLDNDEILHQHRQAEAAAFDSPTWSLNHLRWMQGAQEMMNFGAFSEGRLIGNTSTWRVSDTESVTENIFVSLEWQKQGVARCIISAALRHLQQQGKTVASLGTFGTNRKAIRLYTELGYELTGIRMMVGYEV